MRLDTFDSEGHELEELGSANSDAIFEAMQKIPGGPAATVRNGEGKPVRVISPQKAASYPDLAGAYPDLGDYVRSMAGETIALHTAFFGSPFTTSSYAGTFAGDGSITLTGTSNPPNEAPSQISFQGDQLIDDIETGEGTPNTLEGTIRRDVLSAFSAGLWGGRYGNSANRRRRSRPPASTPGCSSTPSSCATASCASPASPARAPAAASARPSAWASGSSPAPW